jgi:hypothetical protein
MAASTNLRSIGVPGNSDNQCVSAVHQRLIGASVDKPVGKYSNVADLACTFRRIR